MPIYEYECRKCHAHLEVMQKITDKPLTKCRSCGGRLEKQWSSTSFQLKGAGWYVTDYAAKKPEAKSEVGEEKSSAKEEKSGAKEEKAASTKTETTASDKPAPKTKKSVTKTTSSNTGD
jgi:putative FmdB family regulatory protein